MDEISTSSNSLWKEGIALIKLIRSDLSRFKDSYKARKDKFSIKAYIESFIFKPGFQAVLLYRISHFLYRINLMYPAWSVSRINQFLTSAEIEFNAEIGPGLFIAHPAGLVIGRGSVVGRGASFYQGVTLGTHDLINIKFPTLLDCVTVFSGAKILGDIIVESNTVIAANAVVTKNVKENTIVINDLQHKNRVK